MSQPYPIYISCDMPIHVYLLFQGKTQMHDAAIEAELCAGPERVITDYEIALEKQATIEQWKKKYHETKSLDELDEEEDEIEEEELRRLR